MRGFLQDAPPVVTHPLDIGRMHHAFPIGEMTAELMKTALQIARLDGRLGAAMDFSG